MILFVMWPPIATAGCVEDPLAEEHLAASSLIVSGEVVAFEAHVEGDAVELVQHVAIDRSWRGQITLGHLQLHSRLSGSRCPGARWFEVGSEIYVADNPGDDGIVWPSSCDSRVGTLTEDREAWLSELVEARTGIAGQILGSTAPEPPSARAPWGEPGPLRVRLARASRAQIAGQELQGAGGSAGLIGEVIAEGAHDVIARWTWESWQITARVPVADLSRSVVEEATLAPGLTIRPGVPLRTLPDGRVALDVTGVEVSGTLPEAVQGIAWAPGGASTPSGGLRYLSEPAGWFDAPGGAQIGRLAPDGAHRIVARGDPRGGWAPVIVSGEGFEASGWMHASVLSEIEGSVRGGVLGSVSGPRRTVRAGARVQGPDGVVFARAIADTYLSTRSDDSRAWVVLDTPWGRVAGRHDP